jgi:tRNA(fMet)-specific endonuclease VapC
LAILDTSIIVALLKNEEKAKAEIGSLEASGERISTTAITAYELLKGAQISSRSEENIAKVNELISTLNILGLSVRGCEEASKIYKELADGGKMIGEFDILIAAIARTAEENLVSRDNHFMRIGGLKVTRW